MSSKKSTKTRADGFIWAGGAWRSPESVEKRRAANRERSRKRWREDKEYRQRQNLRKRVEYLENKDEILDLKREKYQENIEEERKRKRENKAKQRERNREKVNAKQRAYYKRYASRLRRQINEARVRREPIRGLATALREFERGDRSFDELDRLYRERLAWLNERNVCEPTGARNKNSRHRQSANSRGDRASNKRVNEDKTRRD